VAARGGTGNTETMSPTSSGGIRGPAMAVSKDAGGRVMAGGEQAR
jgi:hypothetical protein